MKTQKAFGLILKFLLALICLGVSSLLLIFALFPGNPSVSAVGLEVGSLTEAFDRHVAGVLTDAEQALLETPKKFWIPENAEAIPARNDSCYGTADSPDQLQWLLDEAQVLLDGQQLLFTTQTQIYPKTKIHYYLDESMFVICWQQVFERVVYTIAEVKISHPSQFRRYFSDGVYGTGKLYRTTELAAQAGAVVASSADHYRGRDFGIVVSEGQVMRFAGAERVDSCFIDQNGDLLLTPRGTFATQDELEGYIRQHDVQFSFSFGPILICDGAIAYPQRYALGEINDIYPRCAVAQKDELHYLLITVNGNGGNFRYPTIASMTEQIDKMGVKQAYALDGGATGAIVMHDELMNPNEYQNGQRPVGDMFFFATAVPNHKTEKTGS